VQWLRATKNSPFESGLSVSLQQLFYAEPESNVSGQQRDAKYQRQSTEYTSKSIGDG